MRGEWVAPGTDQGWGHCKSPALEELTWTSPSVTGPLMGKVGITAAVDNIMLRRKQGSVRERGLVFRM